MPSTQVMQLLFRLGQPSLLQKLHTLPESTCQALEKNLLTYDVETLEQQLQALSSSNQAAPTFRPLKQYVTEPKNTKIGQELLQEGRVGTIIVSGGQASRFGKKGAKGVYPLSLIKQKSLLQLHIEKAIACGKAYSHTPYVAIMTSEATHDEIKSFLNDNNYFGLDKTHIDLFSQSSLPLCTLHGEFIVNDEGQLLTGPDGNGACFWHFKQSGLLAKWERHGVEHVSLVLVDNPLVDPFSVAMLSVHLQNKAEVTAQAILREDPDEPVGIFVEKESGIAVVEYSEMGFNELYAVDNKGILQYPLANISSFICSLAFIKHLVSQRQTCLPLHKATKNSTSEQLQFLKQNVPFELLKLEYFIFDILDFTSKAQIFVDDRANCFCPLKTAANITDVQQALLARDHKQYERISGTKVDKDRLFELSMQFYYPTPKFLSKWKNIPLPDNAYIEDPS